MPTKVPYKNSTKIHRWPIGVLQRRQPQAGSQEEVALDPISRSVHLCPTYCSACQVCAEVAMLKDPSNRFWTACGRFSKLCVAKVSTVFGGLPEPVSAPGIATRP